MGVFFSNPEDKVAYYKAQAAKARREAKKASQAGNVDEAVRLRDVADRAQDAAESNRQLIERASE